MFDLCFCSFTVSAPTKYDKVVKREMCQITSKGTRMYLAIEGDATSPDNAYLLSINNNRG
jgi:DNA mismatch repair protein MSH6